MFQLFPCLWARSHDMTLPPSTLRVKQKMSPCAMQTRVSSRSVRNQVNSSRLSHCCDPSVWTITFGHHVWTDRRHYTFQLWRWANPICSPTVCFLSLSIKRLVVILTGTEKQQKKNHLTCCVHLWRGRDHGLGPTLGSRKACQLSLEEGLSDRQHGEERSESKRVYRARHVCVGEKASLIFLPSWYGPCEDG